MQIKDKTKKRPLRRGARQIAPRRSIDSVSVNESRADEPFLMPEKGGIDRKSGFEGQKRG